MTRYRQAETAAALTGGIDPNRAVAVRISLTISCIFCCVFFLCVIQAQFSGRIKGRVPKCTKYWIRLNRVHFGISGWGLKQMAFKGNDTPRSTDGHQVATVV